MRLSLLLICLMCACLIGHSDSGSKIKEKIKQKVKNTFGLGKNKNKNTNYGSTGYNNQKKTKYGSSSGSKKSKNMFKGSPYAPKKSSSNKMLKLLAGGAGAYLGYKAGKKVLKLIGGAMMLGGPYGNRQYYFDQSMYRGVSNNNRQMCRVNMGQQRGWSDIFLPDAMTPVRTVIFECDAYTQYCCDMNCCTKRSNYSSFKWFHGLIILIVLGCFCCCGAFLFYKFCKSGMASLQSMFGRGGQEDREFDAVPMEGQQQPKGYPAYPAQPPAGYPPAQPQPGYGFDQYQQPTPPQYTSYPPAAQPYPSMYPNVQQPYDYPVKT